MERINQEMDKLTLLYNTFLLFYAEYRYSFLTIMMGNFTPLDGVILYFFILVGLHSMYLVAFWTKQSTPNRRIFMLSPYLDQ